MSMHKEDYAQLLFSLFGWFEKAKASGQSSNEALTTAAVGVLTEAAQHVAQPPVQLPLTPPPGN